MRPNGLAKATAASADAEQHGGRHASSSRKKTVSGEVDCSGNYDYPVCCVAGGGQLAHFYAEANNIRPSVCVCQRNKQRTTQDFVSRFFLEKRMRETEKISGAWRPNLALGYSCRQQLFLQLQQLCSRLCSGARQTLFLAGRLPTTTTTTTTTGDVKNWPAEGTQTGKHGHFCSGAYLSNGRERERFAWMLG